MKKFLITIVLLLSHWLTFSQRQETKQIPQISIVELISNPKKFDNTLLEIKGFFIDFQRYGKVYLTKDDAIYQNNANSVLINYDYIKDGKDGFSKLIKYNKKFISITGTYTNYKSVHHNGILSNITSFWNLEEELIEREKLNDGGQN